MYGLRNLWDKEPVVIAEAVRVVLFTLAMLGIVAIGEKELAGIALAVSAFLSLFVRSKVYSPPTVQAIADRASDTGNTDIGSPPEG